MFFGTILISHILMTFLRLQNRIWLHKKKVVTYLHTLHQWSLSKLSTLTTERSSRRCIARVESRRSRR